MNKTTMIALKAGTAPFVLGLALASGAAYAQASNGRPSVDCTNTPTDPSCTSPGASTTANNEIVVTGSRIARPELDSPVPIAVVTSATMENKGQTNLLDALRNLPVSGQSLDRSASNFQNFDTGVATVNLRNLGTSRTLVLINGRRSIGIPGTTAVDLNNIPADLIDHVEIVTGGTSAVYGSDAVAGVVNIILKNKFEGLELHAQNMVSDKGDASSRFISLTAGSAFAGGAGHIVANLSYEGNDALPASNRSYSSFDTPANSSYAAQGLFDTSGKANFSVAAGNTYTFNPANAVKLYQGAAIDGYTRATQRLLVVPLKRYSATLLGEYEFSPAATLYAEGSYTKAKAHGHIEALAVDDSGNPGQSVLNLDGTPFPGIPVTNPYLPAQIAAAARANGQSFINFRRRSVEIFDRSPHENRDYWRGVIGLKGEIAPGWTYDASYEHSQVRSDTTSQAILLNNYGAALNATTLNGQIVCADPVARAAGCVPANIFGFNTVSPAAVTWLSTYSGIGATAAGVNKGDPVYFEYLRRSKQDVAALNITGSLFRLPAGPVGVAFGVEYHREEARENYDPFTVAGISSAQQATNTVGSYHSKEAYAEINIPIL
ncbi:MAG: TonB-dependent receptor plug domain-containing protein, partial [Novosphingobium sp.]|nr:TonB-dependent receptor plug domain-containing protein [Novosphingobium sp.]